jgi:hypothetical protein
VFDFSVIFTLNSNDPVTWSTSLYQGNRDTTKTQGDKPGKKFDDLATLCIAEWDILRPFHRHNNAPERFEELSQLQTLKFEPGFSCDSHV